MDHFAAVAFGDAAHGPVVDGRAEVRGNEFSLRNAREKRAKCRPPEPTPSGSRPHPEADGRTHGSAGVVTPSAAAWIRPAGSSFARSRRWPRSTTAAAPAVNPRTSIAPLMSAEGRSNAPNWAKTNGGRRTQARNATGVAFQASATLSRAAAQPIRLQATRSASPGWSRMKPAAYEQIGRTVRPRRRMSSSMPRINRSAIPRPRMAGSVSTWGTTTVAPSRW